MGWWWWQGGLGSFPKLYISSSWVRIRLHTEIQLPRLPASTLFWWGCDRHRHCDWGKRKSTPCLLTKDFGWSLTKMAPCIILFTPPAAIIWIQMYESIVAQFPIMSISLHSFRHFTAGTSATVAENSTQILSPPCYRIISHKTSITVTMGNCWSWSKSKT